MDLKVACSSSSDRIVVLLALLIAACAADGGRSPRLDPEFTAPPGSAEPNLALGANGSAILTWHEKIADRRHALKVAVRSGGRWSEPRTVLESDSFFVNWADFPSLVELPNGTWVVHWLGRIPGGVYAYHVNLAFSTDRGATWSRPVKPHRDASPSEHGFVAMVPWDDSTAALVWLDGRQMKIAGPADEGTGDMTLQFTTARAPGRFGPEALLDARTCECCQTALARTASGLVAAYRDRSPAEIRDIAVTRLVNGRWTEPRVVAADNWHYPGCPVNGPQLSARGDTVAIAWFTAPEQNARVFAAFSTDGGATWGAPIRVDDGRPIGRVDVELLSDGDALVSWLEGAGQGRVEVRVRRVSRRGGAGRAAPVAETRDARSSGFPRMLRVGDDVLIAWTTDQGVRVSSWRP